MCSHCCLSAQNLKKNMATEDTAMQLYDLQQSELIRDPVTNTKALIAWSKDTILISFRGTANKQNALHDIQVPRSPVCLLCCSHAQHA